MLGFYLQANPNPSIGFWDIIDFAIAAYLIYMLYKLLKGTAAFNIFIGVLLLYVLWWTVRAMNMFILSTILDQFVSVGVIVLVIIFQPEIRRFLLVVGSTRLKERMNQLESFIRGGFKSENFDPPWIESLEQCLEIISDKRMETVVVVAGKMNHESYINSGVPIGGEITKELLESIINRSSPLHDGAVIVQSGKIVAAGCALPMKTADEKAEWTLRERSAMGISEQTNDFSIVIGQNGSLKYAVAGELSEEVIIENLMDTLKEHLDTTFAI